MPDKQSEPSAQVCAQAYPGFAITCTACRSERVALENTLGYSEESGAWGEVTLVCLDCTASCVLVETA